MKEEKNLSEDRRVRPAENTDTELDDFLPEDEAEELLTKTPLESLNAEAIAGAVRRRSRKRRYTMAVGAVVLIFAFVGAAFLAGTVGKKIYDALTDDSQLRAYDTFLSPIVMQDPDPFEKSSDADAAMVQKASLWRAVTVHASEYTQYDSLGRTIVPLSDVVDACQELFGPDCGLQPKSVGDQTFFQFDTEKNVYYVTPYSTQSSFVPYTVNMKKSGTSTVLKVGYVSAADEWRGENSGSAAKPTPVKYMEYVLKADSKTGSQYVTAIRAAVG